MVVLIIIFISRDFWTKQAVGPGGFFDLQINNDPNTDSDAMETYSQYVYQKGKSSFLDILSCFSANYVYEYTDKFSCYDYSCVTGVDAFLNDHAVNHKDEPFFVYHAMQVPHTPLEVILHIFHES